MSTDLIHNSIIKQTRRKRIKNKCCCRNLCRIKNKLVHLILQCILHLILRFLITRVLKIKCKLSKSTIAIFSSLHLAKIKNKHIVRILSNAFHDIFGTTQKASTAKRLCISVDTFHLPLKSITNANNMYCWGSTVYGELGLGGIEDENILTPRELDFQKATEIEHIACGESHTLLITNDGQVFSCGNNDSGQLGHEKPTKRLQMIPGLDAFIFKQAACGASHSVAVNNWGQLFCWGNNADGQLGLGTPPTIVQMPRMVKALGTSIVVQIACGKKHTLALTNNGELYAWGSNSDGQLGLGQDVKIETRPRLITSLTTIPIAFIACGGYHSIAVSKSGAVFGWGRNTFGQLGMNDISDKYVPCLLKTLRNARVKYVACGEEFSVFLTTDGGVFTCGAGMYGQLGHGVNSNEILPRQVIELMGSVVTQISCGKRHTLALVPSRGKVYAWGLGGSGQLGSRTARSATTPQIVLGPWTSKNGSSAMEIDSISSSEDCVVKHIFSGGDHCFVTVTQKKENIEPDDCRIYLPNTQILSINEEQLLACQRIPMNVSIDHDLMMYIETVFKNQACINASFLLSNKAHYNCSYRQHGVDLEFAARCFGMISEIINTTISELIHTCITEFLLPSLTTSPPDIECLRIYLILPLYHGFANPDNCTILHKPFSVALLSLKQEAMKAIEIWWTKAPKYYFERLVRIYKSVVVYFIKQPNVKETKIVSWNSTLQSVLDTLKFLNKLNNSDDGKIVPYNVFYIRELTECIDVRGDYCRWLSEINKNSYHKIYFCNYPFLFDAEAKTMLLETDQALQMQSAMNEAASRSLTHMLFNTFHGINRDARSHHQFVTLTVSRENIVADTFRELSDYTSDDLKKPLRVKFHGEEAEDAGGVKKEFFMLLLKEILDPKYGMFKEYEETRTIWFSEDSFEDETMYFLIGLMCGLAIYNFIIIELPFPLALYKKLLKEPVGLGDIKDMSPVLARSLQNIIDYEEQDLESVFCLNFEVTREVYGEKRIYELIPSGSKTPVTINNKKQFVELYVDYILNKSVDSHFKAFYKGFHKVCGGRVLELFHSDELMAVVIGNEEYDWEELEKNASYKEGYTKDDPTIILFWQVFHDLTLEQKKKFLLFLTGSDRIPLQGMKAIKITIQPMTDERFLPVAHTCFNLLDLPRYQTRERLQYKLLQAIQQTQGFSLV